MNERRCAMDYINELFVLLTGILAVTGAGFVGYMFHHDLVLIFPIAYVLFTTIIYVRERYA